MADAQRGGCTTQTHGRLVRGCARHVDALQGSGAFHVKRSWVLRGRIRKRRSTPARARTNVTPAIGLGDW